MANRSVCVFCGSATGIDAAHLRAAEGVGAALAKSGLTLVFGGARVGLMGAVADAAIARGGRVVGVMPRELAKYEVAHLGLSELVWADSMHERKARMAERADAFLALPGGYGTFDELFEVLNWRQIGLHDKPIVLLETSSFFGPLVALIDGMSRHGFAYERARRLFTVVAMADDVVPALEHGWATPEPRSVARGD
jgi:uncharacterized protein (TIGR00730 family)